MIYSINCIYKQVLQIIAFQNFEIEAVELYALVLIVELDNLSLKQCYASSSPATMISASEPSPFKLSLVYFAIIQNNISQLKIFLALGEYNINAYTHGSVTPLILAYLFDRLAAYTKLLKKSASILKKNNCNFSVKNYTKHILIIKAIAFEYHISQIKVIPNLKKWKRILFLIRNYSKIQLYKQKFNQGIIQQPNPESSNHPTQSNGQRLLAQVTITLYDRAKNNLSSLLISQKLLTKLKHLMILISMQLRRIKLFRPPALTSY